MTEIMPVPRNLSFTVLPAGGFGCLFFASILAFLLLRLMQQFFDRDAVELRERAEIRRAGVGRAVLPLADRLVAVIKFVRKLLLRKPRFFAVAGQVTCYCLFDVLRGRSYVVYLFHD